MNVRLCVGIGSITVRKLSRSSDVEPFNPLLKRIRIFRSRSSSSWCTSKMSALSLFGSNLFVGRRVGNLMAAVGDFDRGGDFLGDKGPIFDVFLRVTADKEMGDDFCGPLPLELLAEFSVCRRGRNMTMSLLFVEFLSRLFDDDPASDSLQNPTHLKQSVRHFTEVIRSLKLVGLSELVSTN